MRLHEFIQKNMEGELPLLNTKSGHPFLINYCCNDGDFISDYLCQGKQAKQSEWEKIKHYIQEYNEILISLNETYILPQNLSIVKSPQPQLQENTMIQSLNDEILIYSYMVDIYLTLVIHLLNIQLILRLMISLMVVKLEQKELFFTLVNIVIDVHLMNAGLI